MTWVEKLLAPLKMTAEAWQFPEGAAEDQIERAESDIGYPIEESYKDLLRFSNGPCIGRDGFAEFTSVAEHGARSYTNVISDEARERGWLPITTDGCGNDYVIVRFDGIAGRPVAFVESTVSDVAPVYCVASSFREFLFFWVSDQGRQMPGWPLDPKQFDRYDPEFVKNVRADLYPWRER